MRSRPDRRCTSLLPALAAVAALAASVEAPAAAVAPTPQEVAAAVSAVAADPALGGETHVRTLRWVRSGAQDDPQPPPAWLLAIFSFLGSSGWLALWVAGTVTAALAAVWIYRVAAARAPPPTLPSVTATIAVAGLDVRPGSLPADIAAAALAQLAQERVREALSLLYRGALSRIIHRHGLRIGASFTEGEVLGAVTRSLDAGVAQYFSALLAAWRSTVYAGEPVAPETVRVLCSGFVAAIDGPPS